MVDREKVIKGLTKCVAAGLKTACPADCPYLLQCFPDVGSATPFVPLMEDSIALLKEQEKKKITIHKMHVITWRRNDEFSGRNIYEAICETLLDDGELFIARTDGNGEVSYVFYVAEGW